MARGGKKRKGGDAGAAAEAPASKAAKAKPAATAVKAETASEPPKPAAEAANGAPAGKVAAPPAGKGEFRAPDAAEVLEIARTQNLYKSNLFRLQLEELLRELAPKKSMPAVEEFLRTLKDVLEGLVPRKIPEDFAAEFPRLHFQQQAPFAFDFAPPRRIDVVGSFLLGTSLRAEVSVDLAVEIPSTSFRSKDYLNFRYTNKRAAYAGELHRQLAGLCKAASSGTALHGSQADTEPFQGDPFRPCVVVRRPASGGNGDGGACVVRLLPVYSAELFPVAKMLPDRNAVRSVAPPGAADAALPPTALYNSCLLEDSRMRAHLELLHKALTRTPALRDAILLLKRWALARSLLWRPSAASVSTPLSGFCLSILAAHSAQTSNMASSQVSSFQLFKLALSCLASTDWAAQKLTIGRAVGTPLTPEELKACRAHFYDADGAFNFFWRLGPFIGEICWEAKRALHLLDAEADPFEAVFGQHSSSPALLWDLLVLTPPLGPASLCPASSPPAGAGAGADAPPALAFPGAAPADAPEAMRLATRLAHVLAEGLGERCTRAAARLVTREGGGVSVAVGFQLEPMQLERALDRGPQADSPEAQRFRELWGSDKAELRRFKDGSVLECAVWAKPPPGRSAESRRQPAVVTQIVRHLLKRHFPHLAGAADVVAGAVGFVPNLEDPGRRLWVAFEGFRSNLCQLSSLPLTIKDVHPIDQSFSYTELIPRGAPRSSDGFSRTLHSVVVEFESSGRWPDDPLAARKVAAALLLQMREELQNDLGIESDVTEEFLDVRYPEFVFRLRVFHEQELVDVAYRVTNFQAPLGTELPRPELVERLRSLWWRPRVRSLLHANVLQRPALAGAARLCQRWLSTQLLAGYEELAEHLVSAVFLTPSPFETPTSPQVGLCRVFWLLDTLDWEKEPFIVDFDGKLAAEERLAIRRSFERSRAESTAKTLWVASRFDPHAILLETPPATVAAWLRRRARSALQVCHRRLLCLGTAPPGAAGWSALFALDASVFDVVVRLRPPEAFTGDVASEGGARKKGAGPSAASVREAMESLVARLREHLSPVCLVFHDADGHLLALKWRPSAFFPQHHNVLMGAIPHTMVAQEKGQPPLCVPNVLCLTSLVASLAAGMALDISVTGSGGSAPTAAP